MKRSVHQRRDTGSLDRARAEPFLEALRADGMGFDPDEGRWFGVGGYGLTPLFGIARVRERGGERLLDDVYVLPAHRTQGCASSLVRMIVFKLAGERARDLWLLADEDMVAFYERLGFDAMPPDEFPRPLAELCEAIGEWPSASGHIHVAMRARFGS